MSLPKRLAIELAVGAVLGFLAWSILGPTVMTWWYEPPSKDAFSCAGTVKNALEQFVYFELIAAGVGGVVLMVFLFGVRQIFKKTDPA